MIPDDDVWPELFDLVLNLIKNPRRHKLNRSKTMASQLHGPIADFLYEAYTSMPEEFMSATEDLSNDGLLDYQLDMDAKMPSAPARSVPLLSSMDLLAPLPPKS